MLTLAALYGLGMVLASVFLLWGREAWHLTELAIGAGVFRLGPQLSRSAVSASWARSRSSMIPLAVGLDAMRQLAFVDAPGLGGTPPPAVEALILAGMVVVFLGVARWLLRTIEHLARREGRLTARWQ